MKGSAPRTETGAVRESVKTFYDTYGWKKDPGGRRYLGETLHEDLDETVQRYMRGNELRYRKYFAGGGRFFLDAGSGSEPRTEMSRNYQKHVCVDISLVGLQEARRQLNSLGLYVASDLAALPFREGSFDGVLASHCLYHVEKNMQSAVLRELYRVTKTGKNILIFYHSQHNLLYLVRSAVKGAVGLFTFLLKFHRKRPRSDEALPPPLYFCGRDPLRLVKEFPSADVTCLRTLKKVETRIFGKLHLLGAFIPILAFLEKRLPHGMVYVGEYTAMKIQKRASED